MAGYVIADIDVKDPSAYEGYRKQVAPSLERYGGRFLVRGGKAEPLEGAWAPRRLVVVEFDSVERARQWWSSRHPSASGDHEPGHRGGHSGRRGARAGRPHGSGSCRSCRIRPAAALLMSVPSEPRNERKTRAAEYAASQAIASRASFSAIAGCLYLA